MDINPSEIANYLLGVFVALRAIVVLTPTPKDDQFVGKIYKIIEVLALEFGKSKQQPPNKTET